MALFESQFKTELKVRNLSFKTGKHSLGFVNRKLLSTKSKERNMVDPFVAVSVAFAGVLLLVLVLGLCASCHGKEERWV